VIWAIVLTKDGGTPKYGDPAKLLAVFPSWSLALEECDLRGWPGYVARLADGRWHWRNGESGPVTS
jgi:hypothetical protein